MNVVRRMPFAELNVPCECTHSSISNEVVAEWQQQPHQQQQHPSTKCHCTMFAFCNAAHSFDLQFLAFYLMAFVATECTANICTACTFSFHLLTRLTRKHVPSPYLRDTHTHIRNRPLSLCHIQPCHFFFFLSRSSSLFLFFSFLFET